MKLLLMCFAYMNLIEHWGSGIPRIIDKVKAAGLQEPEFYQRRIIFCHFAWLVAFTNSLQNY